MCTTVTMNEYVAVTHHVIQLVMIGAIIMATVTMTVMAATTTAIAMVVTPVVIIADTIAKGITTIIK